MALTVELWEDSGAVTSSHGTTRQLVNNIGWKDSSTDETYAFADYPIIRPDGTGALYALSYKKYNYLKFYGTRSAASNIQMVLSYGAAGGYTTTKGYRIIYSLTNTYAAPDNSFLAGSYLSEVLTSVTLSPFTSSTGPQAATSYVTSLGSGTFYSCYLVTQAMVLVPTDVSSGSLFGNIGGSLTCNVFDYESSGI